MFHLDYPDDVAVYYLERGMREAVALGQPQSFYTNYRIFFLLRILKSCENIKSGLCFKGHIIAVNSVLLNIEK